MVSSPAATSISPSRPIFKLTRSPLRWWTRVLQVEGPSLYYAQRPGAVSQPAESGGRQVGWPGGTFRRYATEHAFPAIRGASGGPTSLRTGGQRQRRRADDELGAIAGWTGDGRSYGPGAGSISR